MTELTSTPDFNVFAPLVKVDYSKRMVYGRMTQELPDGAREIMDYASSKPLFQKWNEAAKARTSLLPADQQSLGNVRLMHQPIAVGKVTEIDYADAQKAVDIGVHVVDDSAWDKVLKGVLTGFSVGGKYAKKWIDGSNPSFMRYTADPAEVSLVDSPAVPTATFTLIKADGAEELHKIGMPIEMSAPTEPQAPPQDDGDHDEDDAPEPTPVAVIAPDTPPVAEVSPSNPDFLDTSKVQPIQVTQAAPVPDVDVEKVMRDFDTALDTLEQLRKAADEDDAQEAKLKAHGEKVGIARRKGEPLTPPKDYPSDADQYADPANHKWPVDTPARAKAALSYFNAGDGKDKYSDQEWATLGGRIASRASAQLGEPHHYDAATHTIETNTTEKSAKMEQLSKADLSGLISRLQDGLSVAAGQIESDPAAAQATVVAMLTARQGQTASVNPANPVAAAPSNDPSNATVVKADAPAVPPVTVDPVQAVIDKLDAVLTKFSQQPAQPAAPAAPAVPAQTPVGDLSSLLNNLPKPDENDDPVMKMLLSGDRNAFYKAAQLAGTPEHPDANAVNQKIDQALNSSLKTLYTHQLLGKWYTNFRVPA